MRHVRSSSVLWAMVTLIIMLMLMLKYVKIEVTGFVVDEICMTDICITERTGDINPADPYDEDAMSYTLEESND